MENDLLRIALKELIHNIDYEIDPHSNIIFKGIAKNIDFNYKDHTFANNIDIFVFESKQKLEESITILSISIDSFSQSNFIGDFSLENLEKNLNEYDIDLIIKESSSLEDGELSIDQCILLYCQNNGYNENIAELASNESMIRNAIAHGIPKSVAEGKTKLSDHFSKEYIAAQSGKKSKDE